MSEESDETEGDAPEKHHAFEATEIDTAIGGPHDGASIRRRGSSLPVETTDDASGGTETTVRVTETTADAAVVALHGRNGTPSGILALTDSFGTDRVAYLAPAATGREWYPGSLLDPTEDREPAVSQTDGSTRATHLESALALIDRIVSWAAERVGRDRVVLLGFEQGGCLAAEWLARAPARHGGLVTFSGALVSPPADRSVDRGSLADDAGRGTPVLLSCAQTDDRVPSTRVRETATHFERLGGDVDCRLHDGSPQTVRETDATAARAIILSAVR